MCVYTYIHACMHQHGWTTESLSSQEDISESDIEDSFRAMFAQLSGEVSLKFGFALKRI